MRMYVMTKQWATFGLFAGITIVMTAFGVSACSCGSIPDVSVALDEAQDVFAGRVVALELVAIHDVDPTSSFAPEHLKVTFAVHSIWKGEVEELTTVFTGFACCICGFPFEIGEHYLVYTHASTDELTYTSICSRTKLLDAASDDLGILGNLKPMAPTSHSSKEGD